MTWSAISGRDVKVFSTISADICGEIEGLLANPIATAPPSDRPNSTSRFEFTSSRFTKYCTAASPSKYRPNVTIR